MNSLFNKAANSPFCCEAFGLATILIALEFFEATTVLAVALVFLVYMGGNAQGRCNRLRREKRRRKIEALLAREMAEWKTKMKAKGL